MKLLLASILLAGLAAAQPSIVQSKGCNTAGTPSTTLTCQFTSTATNGGTFQITRGWYDFDQTVTQTASDNCGNTYFSFGDADQGAGGTEMATGQSRAFNITGNTGGSPCTITLTTSSATYQAVRISEVAGLTTTDPIDQSGTAASNNSGDTITVTAGGANAQNDEIAFCGLVPGGAVGTIYDPGTGWSLGGREGTPGVNVFSLVEFYKVISAPETTTCDTTTTTTSVTGFAITVKTLKAAAGGSTFVANPSVIVVGP